MTIDDPTFASAEALTAAYAARTLSPVEVTTAVFERIERLDPALTAFVVRLRESALEAARAAERAYAEGEDGRRSLLGVPVTIKDQIPIAGVKMTQGSQIWNDVPPSSADAPEVERIKAAGGVIVGTTNVPEFGWKGDTGNTTQGPTRNPFDVALSAGGSSGGAAAAAATGMGTLGVGGDGAGSIRIPAALSGTFGIKPSHGLVPWHPGSALDHIVCQGPITRSVADAAALLDVIALPHSRDRLSQNARGIDYRAAARRDVRGLRAAWLPSLPYTDVEPEVVAVAEQAVRDLEAAGVEVEQVTAPWENPLPILETFFATAYASMQLTGWAPGGPTGEEALALLGPGLRRLVERGGEISGAELAAAYTRRLELYGEVRSFLAPYDVLLTPTLPVTAFPAGQDHPETVCGRPSSPYGWLAFTYPFNLTGHPAATAPAGLSQGLPVGLQIVGQWRDDATVLAVAAALEQVRPWMPSLRAATERLLAGTTAAPAG